MSLSMAESLDGWSYVRQRGMDIYNRLPLEFTTVEKVDFPENYLHATKRLLDNAGVEWCFAFGTALGLYRDNGFVPGDTDIDVMVLGGDAEKLRKIFENELRCVRRVEVGGEVHQLAFQSDDKFIIDLCFFYQYGDEYVSYCEGGHWRDSVKMIGGFREVESEFGFFPVPEKIEDYLESRYGDWKTPLYGQQCCSRKEV